MTNQDQRNLLTIPLYASKPQRKIAGTNFVAVTMYRSYDGTVAEYAVFTADGTKNLGTAHYQPANKRFGRTRGYTMKSVPDSMDDRWRSLTDFAIEMAKRLNVQEG